MPERFWRRAYNLSNGKDFRFTTFSFYEALYQDPREAQEPNWLALHNFHGHCFLDSDERNTKTSVNKTGLKGTYDVRVIVDDKKYETGVKITC